MKLIPFLLLLALVSNTLQAQSLVRDIFSGSPDASSFPSSFIEFNDQILFEAVTAEAGLELWTTDGSEENTFLLKDIDGANTNSLNMKDACLTNECFFLADNGVTGTQIWKTDGTSAGTVQVTDNLGNYRIINLTPAGGLIFFLAEETEDSWSLWTTDGTLNGTQRIKAGLPSSIPPNNVFSAGGYFYFAIGSGISGLDLWRSDGTDIGTIELKTDLGSAAGSSNSNLSHFADFNGKFLFLARDGGNDVELWQSDGTIAGTSALAVVHNAATGNYVDGGVTQVFGDNAYILLYATEEREIKLFKSDGTSIEEIFNQPTDVSFFMPSNMVLIGDKIYFNGLSQDLGTAIIEFDINTETGVEFKKILDAPANPFFNIAFQSLYVVNDTGDFMIYNDVDFEEIFWYSNGTAEGTVQISADFFGRDLVALGNSFFISISDDNWGFELWEVAGSATNLSLVKNINTSTDGLGNDSKLFAINDLLLFSGNDRVSNNQLWYSDGTTTGTDILITINEADPRGANVFYEAPLNDKLIYTAVSQLDRELWITDGTEQGTERIRSEHSIKVEAAQDVVYFVGFGDGQQLWVSDGTESGTVLLRDFGKNQIGAQRWIPELITAGNDCYFVVEGSGAELWKSDGTEAGTVLITPIFEAINLAFVNQTLFFSGREVNTDDSELWKSDGTEAGTVMVKEINPGFGSSPENLLDVNGTLYFTAQDEINGRELWMSDGTETGTVLVQDINPGVGDGMKDSELIQYENQLFFSAYDGGDTGKELWSTDGINTNLVKDIRDGAQHSVPTNLRVIDDLLFFSAFTDQFGRELWVTDGSENGTNMFADIAPGPGNSNPLGIR